MTPLLLLCILSILASPSFCFNTDTCSHSKVLNIGSSYSTCIKNKTAEFPNDICFAFSAVKTCTQETYSPCYGDDAVAFFYSSLQIDIVKSVRENFPKLGFSPKDIESVFESCPEAPTKQETERFTAKNFAFLDFVDTDRKCSKEDVEKLQFGFGTCMKNGTANFQVELKSRVKRARGSLKNIVCDTLYDTIGECWRTQFPTCFTEREITYFKEELSRNYQEFFDLIIEAFDKNSPLGTGIEFVDCLERGVRSEVVNTN